MIESVVTAETGLRAFEDGLQVISNNTANLNTPGFKSSTTQFADLFYSGANPGSADNGGAGQLGRGVQNVGTTLNMKAGQLQTTGNNLDLAINGQGFFTTRDDNGQIHYTQDGQFKFDSNGTLVSSVTGEQALATDSSGNLAPLTLNNLQSSPGKATSKISFTGNVSSTGTSASVSNISIYDSAGGTHTLQLALAPVTGQPNDWTATLTEGTTTIGTSTLEFANGTPTAATSSLVFNYSANGGPATPLTLDFSTNVTSYDTGSISSLALANKDGFTSGTLTDTSFDSSGTLVLTYSNGQTAKGGQLALAQFRSPDDVVEIGQNQYAAKSGNGWVSGVAGVGEFGTIATGQIEASNVDLSQEFSNLVIMQRGYQACSQVVQTAGQMMDSLFGMDNK